MRHVAIVVLLLSPALTFSQDVPAKPPYRDVAAELQARIERELRDKNIPAISIALVDDQRVVWSRGFGFQDAAKTRPATSATVYRVGSVSKLFTDIAVMQLVEKGTLDLDAPVTRYLPGFQPATKPEHKPITLRMLMSHRSGLVREPPVGNYFDPTEPSLEKSVASLNGIPLTYSPGEKVKYSNAAIAVVGNVLQATRKQEFEKAVQSSVIDPLGMASSSFLPTPVVKANLASAVMGTVHGRDFPAPTFELGMAPAGCMYSTVTDLSKFLSALFVEGKPVLKPESLKEMLTPQFPNAAGKSAFGLGFALSEIDGHASIGHGGAVYGFATELVALPQEKLGVVVIASRDVVNGVTSRLASEALRLMLAAKAGKALPKDEAPIALTPDEARELAGQYRSDAGSFELEEFHGRLWMLHSPGSIRVALKRQGSHNLVVDDALAKRSVIERKGDVLVLGGKEYTKEPARREPPPPPPERWLGLIGEYGWDHNTLFILERDGKLFALIEWIEFDELTELGPDEFAFPKDRGMYHGETLRFTRDPRTGRATKVTAANVTFQRREIVGEHGGTWQTKPVKPIAELRKAALAAKPPVEPGPSRKPDLVDLATVDRAFRFDIRYATDNNFLGTPFYTSAKAFFQRPAAEALKRAQAKLAPYGYGLLIHDTYRPWHVTKMFWDATPAHLHNFVADPAKGSRHNRGCAVDHTLYDLATGKPIEMVSGYDEMTDRAFPLYPGGTSRQRWHRDLLRRTMESEGFAVYSEEWWHFDFKDWPNYPILNRTFEELAK